MFRCDICEKVFNSSQAFGGHRSSHFRFTGMKNLELLNYKQPQCLFCKKNITSHARRNPPKFCNVECWRNFQKQEHDRRFVKIGKDTLDITYGELEEYCKNHQVCDICGKSESLSRKLAVDHDHITKRFRGLLCYKCNTGIGYYENHMTQICQYLNN